MRPSFNKLSGRAGQAHQRWIASLGPNLKVMPGDFLEIVDVFVYAFIGWRYILSSAFRRRTHKRWRVESRLTIFFEILGGAFGVGLTLLPLWLVIDAIRG